MGRLIYLKDVATLELDRKACTGCGMCAIVCPRGVFRISDRKANVLEKDSCMECGACSRNCPAQAIFVRTGVGCATAVINSMLGFQSSDCCCSLEQYEQGGAGSGSKTNKGGCC
ncbi:MAG: mercury methylation ferredoxin HgcB [Syntrophobacteraceae bacterium]